LIPGGANPRYSHTGHIVYGVDGTLRAAPFDLDRLEVTGDPVPVLEGMATKFFGAANFGLARDGALVYATGSGQSGGQRTLVWVDREGREDPLPDIPTNSYWDVRVSPDGTRLAVAVGNPRDVWTYDAGRATLGRLTTNPAEDGQPLWTLDGQRIVFTSNRDGQFRLFSRPADGTGQEELLLERNTRNMGLIATGWSPGGTRLLFTEVHAGPNPDIGVLSMDGGRDAQVLIGTEFIEDGAVVSPDGRWIAYTSWLSGRAEIYVQRFPELGERQQVSTNGGVHPVWSRDGRELFYRSFPDGRQVLAVPIQPGPTLRVGRPEVLFEGPYFLGIGPDRPYHLAPDGRFVMIKVADATTDDAPGPDVILVQNWAEELRAKVPKR
jgi:serine/threonine-protein kinase